MCQLRALLDEKFGKVESAKPKLVIVRASTPPLIRDPPMQRPAVFAAGLIEGRRKGVRR